MSSAAVGHFKTAAIDDSIEDIRLIAALNIGHKLAAHQVQNAIGGGAFARFELTGHFQKDAQKKRRHAVAGRAREHDAETELVFMLENIEVVAAGDRARNKLR